MQVEVSNLDPLDPGALADLRPIAYQKATVLLYIKILMNRGDALYRQNTRETLQHAGLFYREALDLIGDARIDRGVLKLSKTQTVAEIQELKDPDGYFGIPENPHLDELYAVLKHRQFTLRHGLTIDGKPDPLPLYAPPIDPANLVAAVAQGASVQEAKARSVSHQSAMKLEYLIEKAKDFTRTAIVFGGELLRALEKRDAEQIFGLQAKYEAEIAQSNRDTLKSQLDQIDKSQAMLDAALRAAKYRTDRFSHLLDENLNPSEITALTALSAKFIAQTASIPLGAEQVMASLFPTIFGLADGGQKPAEGPKGLKVIVDEAANAFDFAAVMAEKANYYIRRKSGWEFEKRLAQFDTEIVKMQTSDLSLQIAIAAGNVAQVEVELAQKRRLMTLRAHKITNEGLYHWMSSAVSSLYFIAFQQAHSLALLAQQEFLGLYAGDMQPAPVISGSYWSAPHQGLLAGEKALTASSAFASCSSRLSCCSLAFRARRTSNRLRCCASARCA